MNFLDIVAFPVALVIYPFYLGYHTVAKPVCIKCKALAERSERKRLIRSIPTRTWRTISKSEKGQSLEKDDFESSSMPHKDKPWTSSEQCSICLEYYVSNKSKVMRLACSHEFHSECISQWLNCLMKRGCVPECPLCKTVVRSPKL